MGWDAYRKHFVRNGSSVLYSFGKSQHWRTWVCGVKLVHHLFQLRKLNGPLFQLQCSVNTLTLESDRHAGNRHFRLQSNHLTLPRSFPGSALAPTPPPPIPSAHPPTLPCPVTVSLPQISEFSPVHLFSVGHWEWSAEIGLLRSHVSFYRAAMALFLLYL